MTIKPDNTSTLRFILIAVTVVGCMVYLLSDPSESEDLEFELSISYDCRAVLEAKDNGTGPIVEFVEEECRKLMRQ